MYCKKCGNLLNDNDQFCMKCGTRTDAFSEADKAVEEAGQAGRAEQSTSDRTVDTSPGVTAADASPETAAAAGEAQWNAAADAAAGAATAAALVDIAPSSNSLLDTIVLKFGDVIMIIVGIVYLILVSRLFGEGGFWGIAFGILFLLAGIFSVYEGVKDLFSRSKEALSAEEISKKKKEIGSNILIIIGLSIFISVYSGGSSVYENVKKVSFETYGTETIGEIVENSLKNAEWSKEKIDSDAMKVYVEGYSPLYDEDVQICFYYEESGDTYEVTLQKIVFPDSNETYDSVIDTAIVWATFYN